MKKKIKSAFSIAEIVISMAIIGVVLIAAFYNVLRRQPVNVANALHGEVACYYNVKTSMSGETRYVLTQRQCKTTADGGAQCGPEEEVDVCRFNMPPKANFEVIVIGGGGGGGAPELPKVGGMSVWNNIDGTGENQLSINVVNDLSSSDFVGVIGDKTLRLPARSDDWTGPENTLDTKALYENYKQIFPDEDVYKKLFLENIEIEALGASGEGAFTFNNNRFPDGVLPAAPGGPGGKAVWRGDLEVGDIVNSRIYEDAETKEIISEVVVRRNSADVVTLKAKQGASPYLRPRQTADDREAAGLNRISTEVCTDLLDAIFEDDNTDAIQKNGSQCWFKRNENDVVPFDGTFWFTRAFKSQFDGLNCGHEPKEGDGSGRMCVAVASETRDDFCCAMNAGSGLEASDNTFCDRFNNVTSTNVEICGRVFPVGCTCTKREENCQRCHREIANYSECWWRLSKCTWRTVCRDCNEIERKCTCWRCNRASSYLGVNCGRKWHMEDNDYYAKDVSSKSIGNLITGIRSYAEANQDITQWASAADTYAAKITSRNNVTAKIASKIFSYEYNGGDGADGYVEVTHVKSFPNNKIEICQQDSRNCINGYVGRGGIGGKTDGTKSQPGNNSCFGQRRGECTTVANGGHAGSNASDIDRRQPNTYRFKYSAPNGGEPGLCISFDPDVQIPESCRKYISTTNSETFFEAGDDSNRNLCHKNGNNLVCERNRTYEGYDSKYDRFGRYNTTKSGGAGGPSAISWSASNLYVKALMSSKAGGVFSKFVTNVGVSDDEPNDDIKVQRADGQAGGGGAIIIRW